MNERIQTVALTAAIGFGIIAYALLVRSRPRKKWRKVGTVSKLTFYPFKSAKGIQKSSLKLTSRGLADPDSGLLDRSFMVVKKLGKIMQNARQIPKLVLIETKIINKLGLQLSAPGMNPIKIHKFSSQLEEIDNCSIPAHVFNCGEDAARWITEYIDIKDEHDNLVEFEIYCYDNENSKRNGGKRFRKERKLLGKNDDTEIEYDMTLPDLSSFYVTTQQSLDFLNAQLEAKNVEGMDTRTFRTAIHVDADNDLPWQEENWSHLKFGEDLFELKAFRKCARCILTTVDMDTGKRRNNMEPLRTLREINMAPKKDQIVYKDPIFGMHQSWFKF